MSAARDLSARLLELEQILTHASDAFAAMRAERRDDGAGNPPVERIRRLTAALRSSPDGEHDAASSLAMRMLLDDCALAIARVRGASRAEADRLDAAAATLEHCQKLLWRERKLASKEARGSGRARDVEDAWPVELAMVRGWNRSYSVPRHDSAAALRYAELRRLTTPQPMRWLEGLEIVIVPDEQVSQAVYVSGLFEPCTAVVLRALLRGGDTFVDVGANVGLLSLLAARWVGPSGTVVSVEPSSREFARLQDHLARNALDNVRALQTALGGRHGTARLRVADVPRTGHNTLQDRFVHESAREIHAETVPLERLDDCLAIAGVGRVRAIKIDVEGSEPDVLDGAAGTLERDRPAVVLALDADASTLGRERRLSIEGCFRSLGYVVVAIDGDTATLRQVDDLTSPAENFLAAPPEVVAELAGQVPIARRGARA